MTFARTYTASLTGAQAHLVEVGADIAEGPPAIVVTGLPDTVLREARDRVRAAIVNSGRDWPRRQTTISLSPPIPPGHGSGSDLAIAVALLSADGAAPLTLPDNVVFFAELGLDGRLRPVPGVLPAVAAAAEGGVRTVVVAAANQAEAALVPGVRAAGAESLDEVMGWLRDGTLPVPDPPGAPAPSRPEPDFRDYPGTPAARLAAEICAAGGHSLLLFGPPGTGKTMLAERLPTVLPGLPTPEALEVTAIHSAAGQLAPGAGLITRPPFCAPHHTASRAAITGGGAGLIRPGAASLAHRGVLFLDEAPEFSRDVLDALRQPLENGQVTVARARMHATFPARFMLVLAVSPCPYARNAEDGPCSCSPAAKARYLGRLSGPLLDRIDVKIKLDRASPGEIRQRLRSAESSQVIAGRVTGARERATHRLEGTPWRVNAEIPGAELRRSFIPEPGALREIEHVLERSLLSPRGADKVLRVAWTLTDLAGRHRPGKDEVHTALQLFLGEETG